MTQGAETFRPGFVQQLLRLDGKVALIMGGRGALAEAIAATLADLGCDVALASRREQDCADIAARITERFGRRALGLHCDISREEDVRFADVFWPMLVGGDEAQKRYGTNYAIAGKDGVHPGWAGSFVMAYAFLKSLG